MLSVNREQIVNDRLYKWLNCELDLELERLVQDKDDIEGYYVKTARITGASV